MWELLCCRYLDTDDPEGVRRADDLLRRRGYRGPLLWALHVVAFGGCVWNLLVWWDWFVLGLGDVLLGWSYNAGGFASVAVVWSVFARSRTALLVAAVACAIAVMLHLAAGRRYRFERRRMEAAARDLR